MISHLHLSPSAAAELSPPQHQNSHFNAGHQAASHPLQSQLTLFCCVSVWSCAACKVTWISQKAFLRSTPSRRSLSHSGDRQAKCGEVKDAQGQGELVWGRGADERKSLLWATAVSSFSCFYTGKLSNGITSMLHISFGIIQFFFWKGITFINCIFI